MKNQVFTHRSVRCPEEVLVNGRWKVRKGHNSRVACNGYEYDHIEGDWWFDIQTGEALQWGSVGSQQSGAK